MELKAAAAKNEHNPENCLRSLVYCSHKREREREEREHVRHYDVDTKENYTIEIAQ